MFDSSHEKQSRQPKGFPKKGRTSQDGDTRAVRAARHHKRDLITNVRQAELEADDWDLYDSDAD